jgi:hypothetical protein
LAALSALACSAARADFRVGFDQPECLTAFKIVREDAAHVRRDAAAGLLTIRTQDGDIFQAANNCRNLFTVPAPPGDFEVVLAVRRFVPSHPTHHLSLGVFQNDDKLVRITCWWRGAGRAVQLDREDDAVQSRVETSVVDFRDQPFRLRLTRRGQTLAAFWARADGPWQPCGSLAWDGQVRRLGFYAANSTHAACPSTDAELDAFEVLCQGDLPKAEPPEVLPPPKITEEELMKYHAVRGFNYVPSYARNGLVMWDEFDPAVWARELGWIETLRGNTVRIWLAPWAYEKNPPKFLAAVEQAFALAARHKLRLIPTLFNCWPSVRPAEWGFGHLTPQDIALPKLRSFEPYVRAVVEAHRADERVLMWDLVNEPEFAGAAATPFIHYVAAFVRGLGPAQPLTVGFASWPQNEAHASLLDVLTLHLYATDEAGHEGAIEGLKALGRRVGKPVVCNECVVGAVDDPPHAAHTRAAVAAMTKHRMGYVVWGLVDGHIAASRPDRPEGGNSYQSFFHADGTPRAAVAELTW